MWVRNIFCTALQRCTTFFILHFFKIKSECFEDCKFLFFFFVNVYSSAAPIIALTAECKNSSLADALPRNVYLRKAKSKIQGIVIVSKYGIYEIFLSNFINRLPF